MADPSTVVVVAATEGIVDEAVVRRMILDVGAQPGPVYGKNGKRHLRERITGYNNAARFGPWIVLLDLDRGMCPPASQRLAYYTGILHVPSNRGSPSPVANILRSIHSATH